MQASAEVRKHDCLPETGWDIMAPERFNRFVPHFLRADRRNLFQECLAMKTTGFIFALIASSLLLTPTAALAADQAAAVAWKQASQTNSISGYKEFFAKYPRREYALEAGQKLRALVASAMKEVKEVSLEAAPAKGKDVGGQVKDILGLIAGALKKQGYKIKTGAGHKLEVSYAARRLLAGNKDSYWHPFVTRYVVMTFRHAQYGPLFQNVYQGKGQAKTTLKMPSLMTPSHQNPVYIMWTDREAAQYKGQPAIDWEAVYPFRAFRADLGGMMQQRPPLTIGDKSMISFLPY
ncbi:MAG: hypothetical protein AB1814_00350 [Thermodesulfobacteriota bacterium]